jgi:putative ABC transport system permease protein
VLVVAAGLFVRTFTTLVTAPLGFDPAKLLIVSVDARRSNAALANDFAFAQRVADAAARVPGVARASVSMMTPMSERNTTQRVEVSGGPTLPRAQQTTWVNAVAPGWFETYGMRLLAGRDIAATDVARGEPVVVVNEAFVQRFTGGQSPLGQRVKGVGLGPLPDSVIVGVVNDAVYRTVRIGVVPTMYLPIAQGSWLRWGFSLTTKVLADRASIERSLTEALSRTDPTLAFSFRDYGDQLRATVVQERLVAMLSGFFGLLAMLLAALGLYGVTSYSVGRRRPEIAVRIALGASTGGVVRLVLGRVATLLVFGAAIGTGLSLWAAKFVSALVFRVEPRDPITLAGAAVVLLAVGLVAGWLPARRASRLDPAAALRG